MAVGVADRAPASDFGVFGIAYAVYTLVLGAVQAFTAEVLVVRTPHLPALQRREMLSSAAGTAFIFGLCVSLVGWGFLIAGSGPAAQIVPPLFILAPFLFLQDVWRFGFFAALRPRSAAANDLAWIILMAIGYGCFLLGGRAHIWTGFEWSWSGAGALCGVLGMVQSRCLPRPNRLAAWFRTEMRSGGRFAAEYLALYGASQAILVWLGIFAGLAQSAGYRGATLLFGPIQIALNAVRLAATPLVVRAYQGGRVNAAWVGGIAVGSSAAVVACAWGVLLLVLPEAAGRRVLGNTWHATQPVIPVILWLTVVQSFGLGAIVLLRVIGAYQQTFRIRVVGGVLLFTLGGVASLGGSVLAGAAEAFSATVTVAVLWWQGATLRRLGPRTVEEESDARAEGPRLSETEASQGV